VRNTGGSLNRSGVRQDVLVRKLRVEDSEAPPKGQTSLRGGCLLHVSRKDEDSLWEKKNISEGKNRIFLSETQEDRRMSSLPPPKRRPPQVAPEEHKSQLLCFGEALRGSTKEEEPANCPA